MADSRMKPSSSLTADKLRKSHRLDDHVEEWFFQVREVSTDCYLAQAKDLRGDEMSRQNVDPERALADSIADPKQIHETT